MQRPSSGREQAASEETNAVCEAGILTGEWGLQDQHPKNPSVLEHCGGGSAGSPTVKTAAYKNPSGCSVI